MRRVSLHVALGTRDNQLPSSRVRVCVRVCVCRVVSYLFGLRRAPAVSGVVVFSPPLRRRRRRCRCRRRLLLFAVASTSFPLLFSGFFLFSFSFLLFFLLDICCVALRFPQLLEVGCHLNIKAKCEDDSLWVYECVCVCV